MERGRFGKQRDFVRRVAQYITEAVTELLPELGWVGEKSVADLTAADFATHGLPLDLAKVGLTDNVTESVAKKRPKKTVSTTIRTRSAKKVRTDQTGENATPLNMSEEAAPPSH
jgi:hypothetical protein